MQITFNVTQHDNCTLLQTLCFMYVALQQQEDVNSDALLDELNGTFEDDMAMCGLHEDANGDVQYTEHMTYERAQLTSARDKCNAVLEMLELGDVTDGVIEETLLEAIVQRNSFIAQAQ